MRRWARGLGVVALTLAAAGCRSGGAVPRPFPGAPIRPAPARTTEPDARGVLEALVQTALDLRGVPYRNGGTDPTGFDCSGFTQYVFAQFGVHLPREVREQFARGLAIGADQVAAGDLLFFSTTDPGPSHVGIAIGDEAFVHAPSTSGVVRVERMGTPYWSRRFQGARHVELPPRAESPGQP